MTAYSIESEKAFYNRKKGYLVKLYKEQERTEVLVFRTFIPTQAKLSESQLIQAALINYDDCDIEDC